MRLLLLALVLSAPAWAQAAQDITLPAPDGGTVTIDRDDYGVPHISADTRDAVFFGEGFAAAQDRLFQMELFWRSAEGRLAEVQGPDFVPADQAARAVYYTEAERTAHFEAMLPETQAMFTAFVAGVNAYQDSAAANPARYLPVEFASPPLSSVGMTPWTVERAVALTQFFIRRFGGIGGQELERLAELEANGPDWFEENRPINDSTASTIIPGPMPAAAPAPGYDGPRVAPGVAEALAARTAEAERLWRGLGIPPSFGSYAALVTAEASEAEGVLLLGAPQMGTPRRQEIPGDLNRNVTWEVELQAPGLHVAGMTVPGIPGVILGRTADRAWTFTTGNTDNTDTYIEQLEDNTLSRYFYDGAFRDFEVIDEEILVAGGDPVPVQRVRSVHGPVVQTDLDAQQAFTYRYAFWGAELDMADALTQAWQAESREAFEAAIATFPVSFNIFYADREQNVWYWHVGRYPDRADGVDPRLPALGDGTQEWDGFLPFSAHPQAGNPAQGYFVDWNTKPAPSWDQGDNLPWCLCPGLAPSAYDRVDLLKAHMEAQGAFSFEEVQALHAVVDEASYPGSYQQVLRFAEAETEAQNLVPPGQSAFFNTSLQPSPHVNDQWDAYVNHTMKPFRFAGEPPPVSAGEGPAPQRFGLEAAFPNPASLSVTFRYALGGADARLVVYDVLGREVAAADVSGTTTVSLPTARLAPGLYLARLTAGERTDLRRFMVIR